MAPPTAATTRTPSISEARPGASRRPTCSAPRCPARLGPARPRSSCRGEDDERCPVGQSEALFCALKRGANPPCELVIYPGEGHAFTSAGTPSVREDAVRRIVEWLARWTEPPVRPQRALTPPWGRHALDGSAAGLRGPAVLVQAAAGVLLALLLLLVALLLGFLRLRVRLLVALRFILLLCHGGLLGCGVERRRDATALEDWQRACPPSCRA
ncbi:prolyl oligopeptidase family serine peptidase [Acidovorax citrulli]|nr:prolyl oligopeptidase family serine peptidase [Paracidovorax citrulli]